MNQPYWPECQSSMVRGLGIYSDQELLSLSQKQPEVARYFVGLFCRYTQVVEGLTYQHLTQQEVPQDQIPVWVCRIWYSLYHSLQRLDPASTASQTLEVWVLGQACEFLDQQPASADEDLDSPHIRAAMAADTGLASLYSDQIPTTLSPVLSCYLRLGLDALPGDLRFALVLSDTFHWSMAQIATQLSNYGYDTSTPQVREMVNQARLQLLQQLPADIRALYGILKP